MSAMIVAVKGHRPNEATAPDVFLLPHLKDLLTELKGAKLFFF